MASFDLIPLTGLTSYREVWTLQRERLEGVIAGTLPEALVLCEHAPVVTLGRNASLRGLLVDESTLTRLGVELFRVERGGEATIHLPGQLVAYPILKVRERGLRVREYIYNLEEAMLSVAADFGTEGYRIEGKPGVYTSAGKIGAVGVAISRGVSYHGVALNIAPDLSLFDLIVPCGDPGTPTASIASITGDKVSMEEAREVFLSRFQKIFGLC
ncbi:MAG: lipoyl(octanoyl) transferase [Deltaproteobacteria bacterium]|nr:MAG: lipoyl(octanoyl) transferase [Deltaproteobacteria bacterium]